MPTGDLPCALVYSCRAEVGATTSMFPFNKRMSDYLCSTGRAAIANEADTFNELLRADEGCHYDQVLDICLSDLQPQLNGPFSPDRGHTLESLPGVCAKEGLPTTVSAGLIGSCTNSSYQDLSRAANVAQQALKAGVEPKGLLYVTPGSEQIRATIRRDGITDIFQNLGAKMVFF